MVIKENLEMKDWVIARTVEVWNQESQREGIHLTDTLVPRKKYWDVISPKPPTFRDICIWMSGNVFERKFLSSIGVKKGETQEWNGIYYTPDWYDEYPVEIKSRRRGLAKEGEEEQEYEWYLSQLKGYCAIVGSIRGGLIVLSFVQPYGSRTEPEIKFYDVTFTEIELLMERQRILRIRDELEHALANKDHSRLPFCPRWQCNKTISTVVEKPKCLTCDREFETDWGIEKHISSKSGKDHVVKKAKYEYSEEPVCKYYVECIKNAGIGKCL